MAVKDPDELYGLPLEQFVPERGALSRALRDAGDREQAARIAKLPKPSLAAWAVNQLVRTQRRAIADLFAAGDDALRAQAELLAGHGDAQELRDASRRERAAVEELLQAARGLLSSGGHELSPAMLERVADTLHAAALDAEAREQAADGRLTRELRYVGMSAGMTVGALAPAAERSKRKEAKPKREEAKPKREEAKPKREEAKPKREEAKRQERAAEVKSRPANERAERTLEEAQERRDRAAEALERAEEELAAARKAVRRARERSR